MHQPFSPVAILTALAFLIIPAAGSAQAADIEAVERFMDQVTRDGHLQLCHEPFYPPGDCGNARFTKGMRYHWIHAIDARSNENLALIHDNQRNGSTPIFHSAIPGYGTLRFQRLSDEIWCMPEERLNLPRRFHARIAGFMENGYFQGSIELASYGLYVVADTEEKCHALLAAGHRLLQ